VYSLFNWILLSITYDSNKLCPDTFSLGNLGSYFNSDNATVGCYPCPLVKSGGEYCDLTMGLVGCLLGYYCDTTNNKYACPNMFYHIIISGFVYAAMYLF